MKYDRVTVNGVRKLAHVAVWESVNGPVPKGCVIHHINGDKHDNRIDNLCMMTRSAHAAMHTTEYFSDTEKRKKQVEVQTKVHNTPEMIKKHSDASKKIWQRDGYREKASACKIGVRRSEETKKKIRELARSPERRLATSERSKKMWSDKSFRNKMVAQRRTDAARKKISDACKTRIAKMTDGQRTAMRENMKKASRARWSNKEKANA